MKDYKKNMLLALGCFLVIVVLNFFLPRLLPGDPVAYLTGFAEEDMTPAQIDYYRQVLWLAEIKSGNQPGLENIGGEIAVNFPQICRVELIEEEVK